ncbi:hypothetical protein ACFQT0_07030 [Hymenobacter humi]|uniref:Uncharacterized protein n=1 Tax=Hymenobacter humi TaxID=1411620 RepID=A0ABW2U171_9BACT
MQRLLAPTTPIEKIGQMRQLNPSMTSTAGVQKHATLKLTKAIGLVREFHIGTFIRREDVPAADTPNTTTPPGTTNA